MKKGHVLFLTAVLMIVGVNALANPSSTFCVKQGYNSIINGSVGYCDFGDGNRCEEWAFYNGECGQRYKNESLIEDKNETEIEGDNETETLEQDKILGSIREKVKDRVGEKVKERIEEGKEKIEENRERIENGIRMKKNMTFTPWQKRNESECLEGCKCVGAVMVCKTEDGKEITITAGKSGKTITIMINKTKVDSELEIENEIENNRTLMRVKLKDGQKKIIKIMPDEAAHRAIERLKLKVCTEENNCTIEIKEVGEGNKTRIVYEVKKEGKARFLWIIPMKMKVDAQVDAQTGEVIQAKRPWWAFIAKQQD